MISCPNCDREVFQSVLYGREDYEYQNNTELKYFRCNFCEHVFVYPMPSTELISSFYTSYTTHDIYRPSFFSKLIDETTMSVRKIKLRGTFKDKNISKIKVLDFGCGNGNFIALLSDLGIKNIDGFDFDEKARECVIQQDYRCFTKFDEIEKVMYDYIYLNHVIEHLPNPQDTIGKLLKSLKKNGKIIIRTPNSKSLLAMYFGSSWRGWETPRHLNIYNIKSIEMFNNLYKDYMIKNASTSNMMFIGMFMGTINVYRFNSRIVRKLVQFSSLLFLIPAIVVNIFKKYTGEELCFEIYENEKV